MVDLSNHHVHEYCSQNNGEGCKREEGCIIIPQLGEENSTYHCFDEYLPTRRERVTSLVFLDENGKRVIHEENEREGKESPGKETEEIEGNELTERAEDASDLEREEEAE